MRKYLISISLLLFVLSSCTDDSSISSPKSAEGYKPVYISTDKAFLLDVQSPQSFTDPGKMFLYQNFIYVTDYGYGVHVIDNSDPSNPTKVAFISIPGVADAAVKNGYMYADNFTDIVTFDVRNVNNISFEKRVKNVYPLQNQMYPPFATGYFECVDTTKGYVLRWEKTILHNPKCYR